MLIMDITERIKENFNRGFFGKGMQIPELPDRYPAWTFKQDSWIAVAVPTDTYVPFSEEFARVRICTSKDVCIGDKKYDILMLQCFSMSSRNEFAVMCKQFVDPGKNGEERIKLISNPAVWWRNWKEMLGNVSADHAPYDVLGELLVVEQQLLAGKTVTWSGVEHGTNDVETDDSSIEVKSTVSRYGYEVTISSLYQLRPVGGKRLSLAFLRFEKSTIGRSIDDVVRSLKRHGYNGQKLEKSLAQLGLEEGRTARSQRYKLLEWKMYPVDENFPAVTESSFKNDRLPANVIKFSYTIDLSGVSGQSQI